MEAYNFNYSNISVADLLAFHLYAKDKKECCREAYMSTYENDSVEINLARKEYQYWLMVFEQSEQELVKRVENIFGTFEAVPVVPDEPQC